MNLEVFLLESSNMKDALISKRAVKQVLKEYLGQYKSQPVAGVISILMPALGNILVYFVPPLILAKIVDIFIEKGSISLTYVWHYIVYFGVLWLTGEALWRIGMHFMIKFENEGISALAKKAFSLLAARDYDFYTNNFVGSLTKKASSFYNNLERFANTLVFNIFGNVFPMIFALIVLGRYSLWLPFILTSCLVLVIIIAIPIIRRRARLITVRHDASSKMVGRFSDSMTNILAIKSFAREDQELDIYGSQVDKFVKASKQAANFNNLRFYTVLSPLYVATNVVGLIAAIFFSNQLGLSAGTIIVVFSYYSQISRIFWEVNWTYRNIESAISEGAEFTQMIIEPPVVQDTQNATNLVVDKADIVFNDAVFEYPNVDSDDSKEPFLHNFNLHIAENQRIGLVGPSGGGKTTITKLLLRFIDLQSGSISISGQDISKVTQKSLREAISYVPQDPLLFHRSLLENISYGLPNATQEEIINAAKIANAHEFISKLPKGYDTLVGERGVKLSGGQRQRIAIARALLRKSPILVLDEATSALDSESEKYIQEGLWELMKGRTAIVIAHRLSTIRHLDRIIVLKDGKIVQDGTHDDLLKDGSGVYATLWSHQTGGFLEE